MASSSRGRFPVGAASDLSNIRNKIKRTEVYRRLQGEKAAATKSRRDKRKREEAEVGADALPPKQVPRTIEGTRTFDDTAVGGDADGEVAGDEADDEFADIFSGAVAPKVMVTTQRYPSAKVFPFIGELLAAVPRAFYYRRQHFRLSKIAEWASAKGFTHLLVLVEKAKAAHTMLILKLPGGPTGAFKFSSPLLSRDIAGHGARVAAAPEVLLNNFTTRLGRRVARLLGSLFPHTPAFEGRQVATFHNQRDFVFFRQHRYVFAPDGGAAKLQELGPRFTLKPQWLLAGGLDPREGEYEFVNTKQSDLGLTRRTFML